MKPSDRCIEVKFECSSCTGLNYIGHNAVEAFHNVSTAFEEGLVCKRTIRPWCEKCRIEHDKP